MERKDNIYYWLIFLINPFLSYILSLKKFREPIAMNIFWGFCIYYGYTFAIGNESQGSDVVRYVAEIKQLYGSTLNWQAIVDYYNSLGEIDYYRTVMAVFLSRFTDNQRVITLFYAIIYGYFYSRNIWFVIGKLKEKFSFLSAILLIVLFLIMPIWYINGVRMYTAMQIFIFGLLPYIFDGNRKKLIFLYSSVLVHFSFYPFVLLFVLYRLFGQRLHIYFILFCFSWFVSSINIDAVNNIFERFVPTAFQERTEGYMSDEALENQIEKKVNRTTNWYVRWHMIALKWSLSISLVFLYVKRNIFFSENRNLLNIFCITLFFFAIANLLSNLPSGGRYLTIAYFLATALILVLVNQFQFPNLLNKLNKFLVPGYILFIIVALRIGIYSISTSTLFANPIIMVFYSEETQSINDIIK